MPVKKSNTVHINLPVSLPLVHLYPNSQPSKLYQTDLHLKNDALLMIKILCMNDLNNHGKEHNKTKINVKNLNTNFVSHLPLKVHSPDIQMDHVTSKLGFLVGHVSDDSHVLQFSCAPLVDFLQRLLHTYDRCFNDIFFLNNFL